MATITLQGNDINTNGDLPTVGSQTPQFELVDKDLKNRTLDDWQGKKKLISIVPSLDTGVCAESTKKFNETVANQNDTVVLVISADLPFAQSRFCKETNTDKVITLSMMRSRNFAKNYGILINDGPLAGITARAIIVTDANDTITYTELVPEIGQAPNYEQAISAISKA